MLPEPPGCLSDEDPILERLSAVLAETDPVSASVMAAARAVFSTASGGLSQPRRCGGAVDELVLSSLPKLLGPSGQLDALAGGAAADVPGVPARARDGSSGDRPRGIRGWEAKTDLHKA